jgi:hypothetical protein
LSTFSDAILNHSDFNNTPGFQHLVNQVAFSHFSIYNDETTESLLPLSSSSSSVQQLHGYDAEDEMKGNNFNDFNLLNRDGCDSYHGSEESFTESL